MDTSPNEIVPGPTGCGGMALRLARDFAQAKRPDGHRRWEGRGRAGASSGERRPEQRLEATGQRRTTGRLFVLEEDEGVAPAAALLTDRLHPSAEIGIGVRHRA